MSNKTELKKIRDYMGLENKFHHFMQMSGWVKEWDKSLSGDGVQFSPDVNIRFKDDPITFKDTMTGNIVTLKDIQSLVSKGHECFTLIGDYEL